MIGALELLDKEDGRTFSAADMEALGLFANQAAVALQLSRTYQSVARALRAEPGVDAAPGQEDAESRDALELAGLVHEIARGGEDERRACRAILLGFAGYLRTRKPPGL